MKQFLLSILLVLLWILPIQGENKFIGSSGKGYRIGSVASGSVTQANMRISAVDGTAFTDFTSAGKLTPYLNHLLVVRDSAKRVIQGYIKAAGDPAGETLGTEHTPTNNSFETNTATPPANWNNQTNMVGTAVADVTAPAGSNVCEVVFNGTELANTFFSSSTTLPTTRLLLKATYYAKSISGNTSLKIQTIDAPFQAITGSWVQYTNYFTSYSSARNGRVTFSGAVAGTARIDLITFNEVLTPSATGVTITSTKGGATFNWEAKDASFNYNDSSNYTYTIYLVQ